MTHYSAERSARLLALADARLAWVWPHRYHGPILNALDFAEQLRAAVERIKELEEQLR